MIAQAHAEGEVFSNTPPTILREIRSPVGDGQIVDWRWPSPMEATSCESRHMLEMSLPPMSAEGNGCFPEISPGRFSAMGRMFLRPAGLLLQARSRGGHIRVVRCAVSPEQYASTVGREVAWSEPELQALLHLRSRWLEQLFRRLRQELMEPGLASAMVVEACAMALMVESARACAAISGQRQLTRLAAWQERRVRERLVVEGPPPTVAELAQLCGVGPRHLLRLYRNLTGETVTAAISRAQTERAIRLLSGTDLPLKEIAARLGFSSPGAFSAAFRRGTGLSPRLHRQRRHADQA